MIKRLLLLSILLTLAVLPTSALAAVVGHTSNLNPQPVISAMDDNEAGMWIDAADANLEMSQMEAAGIQMVRFDATWQCVEPKPPVNGVHTYDWSNTGSCQQRAPDSAVAMLAQHHLTWLPIIDYSASWDTQDGNPDSPPADDSYYAEYAAAVAARYGPGGAFWKQNPQLPYEPVRVFEIWNEENGEQFWNIGQSTWSATVIQAEAGRYATLFQDAGQAIDAVDPTAKVLVGGVGGGSYANWYVHDMFVADPGLEGHVDGFALHPYASDLANVEHNVETFRAQLNIQGENSAPIYITEVGWPTGNSSVEATRASWMGQLASALTHSQCGIALVSPYAWYDPIENFTLATSSGLLPSGQAWLNGLKAQPSATPLCSWDPASTSTDSSAPSSSGGSTTATDGTGVSAGSSLPSGSSTSASSPTRPLAPGHRPTAIHGFTSHPARAGARRRHDTHRAHHRRHTRRHRHAHRAG